MPDSQSKEIFMTRFRPLFIFHCLLMLGVAGCSTLLPPRPYDGPPNVVLIFADDLGYGDLACFGAEKIQTPNLDRMANEGMRFTSFYVSQAVCSASRAALLTGCYSNRVGILSALGPNAKHGINENETTLAELVKTRDYATAIYGKWHLGHHPQFLPTRHGFDEYYGLPYSNDMWPHHPNKGVFPDLPLIEGEKTIELNPDQTQLTTDYTRRAVDFIERNKEHPFFLYVAHAMPHVPLFVSDKFAGKSEAGLYGDVIMEIDWSVGEILATLKRNKLDRKTLVIFTSDNGPWLSYLHHAGSAGPLREGKGTMWEGGARVPCIMRWPGQIPSGEICDEVAATIDVLPTIASLTNAQLPSHQIDGLDISPLLFGEKDATSPHEAYLMYYDNQLHAVRSGPWKLHLPHGYRTLKQPLEREIPNLEIPVRYDNQMKTDLALYNLDEDIGETKNVANEHPEVVAQLMKYVEAARADLGDSGVKLGGVNIREPGRLPEGQ